MQEYHWGGLVALGLLEDYPVCHDYKDASEHRRSLCTGMNHSIRVLVVADFAPWRGYVRSFLTRQPQFDIVGEAIDGFDAVRQAAELLPDLVLLDIALPQLNGLEAARRIRQCAPKTKILFLSEHCDSDIAIASLSAGGYGYLVKSDCTSELLVAIRAVLKGDHFVSGFSEASRVKNTDASYLGSYKRCILLNPFRPVGMAARKSMPNKLLVLEYRRYRGQ